MSLKYFNVLINNNKMNASKVSQEILIEFCNESYTHFIDDFAHFLKNMPQIMN